MENKDKTVRRVISTSNPRLVTVGGSQRISKTIQVVYHKPAGYKRKNGKEALTSTTRHELTL